MKEKMFTAENAPQYGQKVLHGNDVVTVQCFMGVIADTLYGTKDAWATISKEDGSMIMCSLYDLRPCE